MRKASRQMPAEWALEVLDKAPYVREKWECMYQSAFGRLHKQELRTVNLNSMNINLLTKLAL